LTAPRPRHPHKLASLALRAFAGLLCLVGLAGGTLAARLWQGPITISGLGPMIADVLDARLGHRFVLRLGDTALVGGAHFPTFTIDTLALSEPSGRAILSAPHAKVSLDPFALFLGVVTPRRLEIFDVELRLSLLPDGSLALPGPAVADAAPPLVALEPGEAASPVPGAASASDGVGDVGVGREPAPAPPLAQAMSLLRTAIGLLRSPDSPIGAIDRIGITHGRLVIDDRTADRTLSFHGLDVTFVKSPKATTFDLSVDGPNGRWSATGRADGAPGTDRGMTLAVRNLSLDEVLLASGARSLGADFNMPASLEAEVGLNADGTLRHAGGRFRFGTGYLRFDDPEDEPMMIDEITGGFRVEPATGRVVIERSRLVAGTTHLSVSGAVVPPSQGNDPWTIGLAAAEPGVAGPERPGQSPVRIDVVEVAARLFPDDRKLLVDRLAFSGPDSGFAMAGTIDWASGPRVRLGASISPTPVKTVLRLWPSFMVAPVRAWLLAHATEGMFQSGTLQVDFDAPMIEAMRAERAPPDGSVLLDFTISGGGLELLPGVPPMRGFDGKGHVTGRTSSFVVSNGLIDLGNGHLIAVPEGSFHIADADLRPVPAVVAAKVSASVETIAKLLSYDRLKPYARLPMDLTTMRGQVEGRLSLGMKLDPRTRPEDNPLEIHAQIASFDAERVLGSVGVESGSATIDITPSGLRAVGQGQILGAPATFDVTQAGVRPARASVKLALDESFLSAHGFGAAQGIGGSIAASIVAPLGVADKPTAEVELDLSRATLDLPGISKPEGRPGKVAFTLAVKDRTTVLERVSVEVPPADARGTVELGADLALLAAKFPIVKLSPGDDMKIEALRIGDAVKVIVRGSAIDARPFLKTLLFAPSPRGRGPTAAEPSVEGGGREIEVDVKASLLSGYNRFVVTGAEVRMVKRGEELRQLTLAGRFGREPLSANLTGAPAAPLFNLSTEDGGSLLGFLDLYKHMEGGQLSLGVRLDRGSQDGLLVIRDFVLRDEPALRRLVDEGVPASSSGRQAKIDAGAVAFSNLQVQFRRAGNRLDLTDGTMSGSAIGLTVDGWLDYVADRVDVTGTFIPAFALNNMFSKIPVFGTLLGGGTNEGLLGVNFRLEGRASAPALSINPLSFIAPGIFRKIFGVGDNAFPAGAAQ
jgi:hypothetical protein